MCVIEMVGRVCVLCPPKQLMVKRFLYSRGSSKDTRCECVLGAFVKIVGEMKLLKMSALPLDGKRARRQREKIDKLLPLFYWKVSVLNSLPMSHNSHRRTERVAHLELYNKITSIFFAHKLFPVPSSSSIIPRKCFPYFFRLCGLFEKCLLRVKVAKNILFVVFKCRSFV